MLIRGTVGRGERTAELRKELVESRKRERDGMDDERGRIMKLTRQIWRGVRKAASVVSALSAELV